MNINATLKKEGINVIKKLDTLEINKIASNISEKICNTFPEHNIKKSELFIAISRLNMYIAEMPNDTILAKYFYKNNSIYFSQNMDLNDLNTLAVHECIHFMQELKNRKGKLLRLGLYNMENNINTGLAINEASVQLMASLATNSKVDTVKYYNMELTTESPDYYPLQTTLLNEMIYFTGSYPLFHSTLFSNDVFKNTFIAKSSVNTYNKIEYNLDLILLYEEKLSEETYRLSISSNTKNIKKICSKIDALKQIIFEKTLETQNIIIYNCFNNEFDSIKNLEDVKKFQYRIYNFKKLIINTENYNYYNEFYRDMMNKLDEKREFIKTYGNISEFNNSLQELASIREQSYGFKFFKKLFTKYKLIIEDKLRAKNF